MDKLGSFAYDQNDWLTIVPIGMQRRLSSRQECKSSSRDGNTNQNAESAIEIGIQISFEHILERLNIQNNSLNRNTGFDRISYLILNLFD